MTRIVAPTGTRLVYVESRGWLLGKLGIGVLVMAGVVLVSGPLVAGRPHAMNLASWLAWAAIALVTLGAAVRVAALGGYGIQTSAALGEACAHLALGRGIPPHLADAGVSAATLGVERLQR